MIRAVIRKENDGFLLTTINQEGFPLHASTQEFCKTLDEARDKVNHLDLTWETPEADSDENVLLIGKK